MKSINPYGYQVVNRRPRLDMEQVKRTTWTVKETAVYLGISIDKVYEMVRFKEIPYFRIGRRVLFKKEAIDKWIDERMNEGIV